MRQSRQGRRRPLLFRSGMSGGAPFDGRPYSCLSQGGPMTNSTKTAVTALALTILDALAGSPASALGLAPRRRRDHHCALCCRSRPRSAGPSGRPLGPLTSAGPPVGSGQFGTLGLGRSSTDQPVLRRALWVPSRVIAYFVLVRDQPGSGVTFRVGDVGSGRSSEKRQNPRTFHVRPLTSSPCPPRRQSRTRPCGSPRQPSRNSLSSSGEVGLTTTRQRSFWRCQTRKEAARRQGVERHGSDTPH